jgi:hypothetical protein
MKNYQCSSEGVIRKIINVLFACDRLRPFRTFCFVSGIPRMPEREKKRKKNGGMREDSFHWTFGEGARMLCAHDLSKTQPHWRVKEKGKENLPMSRSRKEITSCEKVGFQRGKNPQIVVPGKSYELIRTSRASRTSCGT